MASEPLSELEVAEEGPERPGRWRRLRGWLSRTWQRMQPGPRARKGAAWGAATVAGLVLAVTGIWFRPGLGPVLDIPAGMLIMLIAAAVIGLAMILAFKLIGLLPRFLGWAGFGALGVFLFFLVDALDFPGGLGLAVGFGIIAVEAALGGALALLLGRERLRPWKRRALAGVVVAALAVNAWLVWWLIDRGDAGHLVKVKASAPARVEPLAAADPSRPGPYRVLTLSYGSGKDRWRPEFGAKADLKTRTVDATPFVKGNEGWGIGVRDWFWGFGFDKFPLNGRVWYPQGPGPFPLVLVVHGNHNMADFSDPGYAWLGELLASRGFITVSVDENFFNGSSMGGLEKENDGRGWLLLKHVEAWHGWNRSAGNPFHRKVDLNRVALIGHSRGGEAAAIAAAFNRLPRYPDDATEPLGFNFGIRSVVAIAPSDGQYKPAGKPTPLPHVNYLTLQGAHDGDVSFFMGESQYRRLTFDKNRYAFKAALYSYRSNHGQWNTVWGDADAGWPLSFILNREPLLDPEAQRRLGAVYISGFLEATLHDNPAYIRLFRDARSAAAWLPKDLYITRFQDSTFETVADYEEDVNVATASLKSATLDGRHLALWKETDLAYRQGESTKRNQVAYLGWKRDPKKPKEIGAYAVRLPADLKLGTGSLLVFSLADSGEEPPDPKEKEKKKSGEMTDAEKKAEEQEEEKKQKEHEARKEREKKEGKEPLDFTVELVDAAGTAVRLPLSRFRPVPVPLESRFTKLKDEEELFGDAWEPALQTFELPLRAFAAAKPGFDPAALREVRFVFDRRPEGVVILDDLGFAEAGPQSSSIAASR